LLYATWVEHWLNQMIQTGLARNGLSPAERNQALRQLPFPAKVSWVLPACGLRRIAAHHQKALIEIGDLRNWFIHYKWQGEGEDLPQRTAVNRAVENIDKSITYLRRFERRELFGEEKDHVQRYMARNRAKRK
jgi:hypothetical protein